MIAPVELTIMNSVPLNLRKFTHWFHWRVKPVSLRHWVQCLIIQTVASLSF